MNTCLRCVSFRTFLEELRKLGKSGKSGNNVSSKHRKKQKTVKVWIECKGNSPWLSDCRVFFALSNKMNTKTVKKSSSIFDLFNVNVSIPSFQFETADSNRTLDWRGSQDIHQIDPIFATRQKHCTTSQDHTEGTQSRICKFDNAVRFQKQKKVKLECLIAWMHSNYVMQLIFSCHITLPK